MIRRVWDSFHIMWKVNCGTRRQTTIATLSVKDEWRTRDFANSLSWESGEVLTGGECKQQYFSNNSSDDVNCNASVSAHNCWESTLYEIVTQLSTGPLKYIYLINTGNIINFFTCTIYRERNASPVKFAWRERFIYLHNSVTCSEALVCACVWLGTYDQKIRN